MLFNSFIFVFAFLPLSLALTYGVGRWNRTGAKVVLLALSLGFYALWSLAQVPLLLWSIGFNFVIGELLHRARAANRPARARILLIVGLTADLAFLGWFKYANFFVDNLNWATGAHIHLAHIILPLAISFFTFQKIAYLVDTARGQTRRVGLLDFSLFAAFYPQLIAGPIVHFKEVMPQLQRRLFGKLIPLNLMVGLVTFSIGMFKKTVLADSLAVNVNHLYTLVGHHQALNLSSAWLAAVGYTFQLYFDFSGYSDMAIGLGRMLGVKLPLNFHSPLRAPSIIDYWRRWHMTLQRFIVSYIFQPMSLPLNRLAAAWGLGGWNAFLFGAALPILITFTLSGLWHGAGWTYVLYGLIHGVYLSVNEAWREYQSRRRRGLRRAGRPAPTSKAWMEVLSRAVTLLAVIWSQVMFRSTTPGDALGVWRSMSGLGTGGIGPAEGLTSGLAVLLAISAVLIFLMPNSQQIMGRFDPAWNWREWRDTGRPPISWTWKPNLAGILFVGAILFLGVCCIQRGAAIFLYFNF